MSPATLKCYTSGQDQGASMRAAVVASVSSSLRKLATYSLLALVIPTTNCASPTSADPQERLVVQSCALSDEWIQKLIDASTDIPPPTKEEVIKFMALGKLDEIEISFYADNDFLGTGRFMGRPMPYWITDDYVGYMTADDKGVQNAILHRYSNILVFPIGGVIPVIKYTCQPKA
jgi:hypothetical protein